MAKEGQHKDDAHDQTKSEGGTYVEPGRRAGRVWSGLSA
jgi:hypothetical protein